MKIRMLVAALGISGFMGGVSACGIESADDDAISTTSQDDDATTAVTQDRAAVATPAAIGQWATLFSDSGGRGRALPITGPLPCGDGNIHNLPLSFNDITSSVQVLNAGCTLTLFENTNGNAQGGISRSFVFVGARTQDVPLSINDKASSIQ